MAYNKAVDDFRDKEYPLLKGKVYLDHGGTTLYAKSLIERFSQNMISNLYGNPHSASAPAQLSGDAIDRVREQALRFFGADSEHFDLVFVANATAAVKLVMDSFRDLTAPSSRHNDFQYLYHKDSHTSLVGVREVTDNHRCFINDAEVETWLEEGGIGRGEAVGMVEDIPCLFAYPGQSNFNGRRLPLSWCGRLRNSRLREHQSAYSLLDVAALASTSSLRRVFADPAVAPDFTALSFYKIFGFPDVGALIVRKQSAHVLTWRRYFGGGTVNMISVLGQSWHYSKDSTLHENLEDGTLPFHSIVALGCAIDVHHELYGDMDRVSKHTQYLGHQLFHRMRSMRHRNGQPLCIIYNELANQYDEASKQGSTVTFNLMRADGSYISYSYVEQLANSQDIYVRAGGLCNAGGIASYLGLAPWQMKRAWSAGHRCGGVDELHVIGGKPTGVVRVSLGAMSTIGDIEVFIAFLSSEFLGRTGTSSLDIVPSSLPISPTSLPLSPTSLPVSPTSFSISQPCLLVSPNVPLPFKVDPPQTPCPTPPTSASIPYRPASEESARKRKLELPIESLEAQVQLFEEGGFDAGSGTISPRGSSLQLQSERLNQVELGLPVMLMEPLIPTEKEMKVVARMRKRFWRKRKHAV